jgi:hypothetical protein
MSQEISVQLHCALPEVTMLAKKSEDKTGSPCLNSTAHSFLLVLMLLQVGAFVIKPLSSTSDAVLGRVPRSVIHQKILAVE